MIRSCYFFWEALLLSLPIGLLFGRVLKDLPTAVLCSLIAAVFIGPLLVAYIGAPFEKFLPRRGPPFNFERSLLIAISTAVCVGAVAATSMIGAYAAGHAWRLRSLSTDAKRSRRRPTTIKRRRKEHSEKHNNQASNNP
jgi:hypothetical protein